MLCSLQGDFSCLFHVQFHCLYILAVGSYHNLEVAWFYHVLQICVVELEHIWGDIKAYLLALTYCQMDALETFQLLYRTGDAGYHVTDVELHNLVGIAGAVVLNGDASCNLLAILPFGSLLIADAGLLDAQAEVAV